MAMWLKNISIWDGVSDALIEGHVLKVDGKKFVDIVPLSSVPISVSDEEIVDMKGLVAIPGLIDAHVHMCLDPTTKQSPTEKSQLSKSEQYEAMVTRGQAMLKAGITTARDLGGGKWLELVLRDEVNAGTVVATQLLCAGQPITSVKGHCHFWGGEAENIETARRVIQRQMDRGVDLIKIMATGGNITPGSKPVDAQFDVNTISEMVRYAKQSDYLVAAHCHGVDGIRNAAAAGVTTIEHCSWVGESGWGKAFDHDVIADIVAQGIWVSPTINLGWKRFMGANDFERLMTENYKKMRAAGVKLIASTDAGIPNVKHEDLPKALPVFAHFASLSNIEVLRAATSDCAQAIGLGNSRGRIEKGYDADCLFFDGNPLEDLSCLELPQAIMCRGEFLKD